MAKKSGLGKGLDSLIPDFYNKDFNSNSSISLEDMLKEETETKKEEEIQKKNKIDEDYKQAEKINIKEKDKDDKKETEEEKYDEIILTEKQIKNIAEVKRIVHKNPRITLWSSRSACVFRYLRKTEPEFSISKEASILIDKAVSKKYPKIWKMFEEELK